MRVLLEGEGGKLYGFRHFWAKHVRGFDGGKHCARCLVGSYEKLISASMPLGVWADINLAGDVLYICGVSNPYRWEKNFHLAVKNGGNRVTETLYNGVAVTVDGAEKVVFDDAAARELYPRRGAEFLTCRNFQFGAHYYGRR
jgi:hypothetical protein